MTKPIITSFSPLTPLTEQPYERYLPTAFDENLSILQKINKVINDLGKVGELTNGVVEQWNAVMEWVLGEGISESVNTRLDEMEADGTLAQIINVDILNLKASIEYVDSEIAEVLVTVNGLISDLNTLMTTKADIDYVDTEIDTVTQLISVQDGKLTDLETLLYTTKEYINLLYPPAPYVGAVGDGLTDDSLAIQNLVDLKKPIIAPPATYRIANTVKLYGHDFIGCGMSTIFDIDACDGFMMMPDGGRKVVKVGNFSVVSKLVNTQNYVAFTSLQHETERTAGVKFFNIEIGGGGIFGAGFRLHDMFRLSIDHVGMTDCLNGVILEGQVVQATFNDITSNVNSGVATTVNNGKKYGFCTFANSVNGQMPESIKVNNCNFVGHDWGVWHYQSLFTVYNNMDLDYNKIGGFYIAHTPGGCTINGAWIANKGSTEPTYGILVDLADFERQPLNIENIHISYLPTANINSIGVQTNANRRRVNLKNITVKGGANIKNAFLIQTPKEMTFENNVVFDGVCVEDEILITGATESCFNRNYASRMKVHGDGSWMEVRNNSVTTLTLTGTNEVRS